MSGINEQSGELQGMSPAELALIKASLREARATVERLVERADQLTVRVESRYPRSAQGGPVAHRVHAERHGSC